VANTPKLVRHIVAIAVGLGGVTAAVLGWQFGWIAALSSALGTAIGVVNLWALARLVAHLLEARGPANRRGAAAVLLGGKVIALVAIVGILVIKGRVHGGALMAGLSVVAVSIVLGALLRGDDDASSPGSLA
jgi:hypothetical protein